MTEKDEAETKSKFIMIADHPVLDLLNTVPQIDGVRVDLLQSDDDVLRWMSLAGWAVPQAGGTTPMPSLLKAARKLREVIRLLVESLKAGKQPNVTPLNDFLKLSRSHLLLHSANKGRLEVAREWQHRTSEELLAPVAEAAADFLATADFELVRRCEDSDCVLWFYDRTRSHHRRWCSMATCGNRNKVAAYRERKQKLC